jgi:hypothetical protein
MDQWSPWKPLCWNRWCDDREYFAAYKLWGKSVTCLNTSNTFQRWSLKSKFDIPSFRAKLISLLKADARQYSWSPIPHGWRRANSQSSWKSRKHQQQERSSSNISVSPLWLNRFPIIHTFAASICSLQFWAAFRLVSPNLHYFPGTYSAPCITKSQTRH